MSAVELLDLRDEARAAMPALPELPHVRELHRAAQGTWLGRMVNEHASSSVFVALAEQLDRANVDASIVRACAGFAVEERRHGVACGAVVEALGGQARASVPERPEFPRHVDVDRREAALRNALSVCCLSETVAVALISAEREEMDPGPLRDLLTSIWSDEIGHARFGWSLLSTHAPDFDAATRARLGAYLGVAFAHVERHELLHLPSSATPPREGRALGLCNGAAARALFYDTITEAIVPRLESLGLDARRAWDERGAVCRA